MSVASWRRRATLAHRQLEQLAAATATRTGRTVLRDPSKRHDAVADELWGGKHAAAARAAALGARMARSLTGQPPVKRDPAALLADVEAREYQRAVEAWRARGPVEQIDGRWMRPGHKGGWVPVLTQHELIQQRVYRAQRRAMREVKVRAKQLGVKVPRTTRGGREVASWDDTDPRLADHYRRRIASETARIVDDVIVDTHRAATLDELERLGLGWVRKAEPGACGACLALTDGRVHPPTDRAFPKHTRCRCILVPAGPAGERPPTGREQFDALSRSQQDALFDARGGAGKAELIRTGELSLEDLVKTADRPDTDYVIGERTLAEALDLVEGDAGVHLAPSEHLDRPAEINVRARRHWQVDNGRDEIVVEDVQRTIAHPELVLPDPRREHRMLFVAPWGERGSLRVVVDTSTPTPQVVTALRQRRLPKWMHES